MIAELLAALIGLALDAPAPSRLDDPARVYTRLPEGRVLVAEARRERTGPRLAEATLGPVVRGGSAVVLDVSSGAVLAAQDPSEIRPVASLMKLLTALTVVRRSDMNAVVEIPAEAARRGRIGADMGLLAGERLRVRDLLAGLLIPSANDAALALAFHVAGSEESFVTRMAEVANDLGLKRTQPANATGFDDVRNFSTAYDVALLLKEAWQHPEIGPLLRAEEAVVSSLGGRPHYLSTTNRLLGVRSDVLAGKTGLTEEAGENLAVVAESPDGHSVVAVVIGSPDRYGDVENLLNWTFWAYAWGPQRDHD